MKLLRFVIVALLMAVLPAAAQEFKLGKVSKAELQEKVHPADTSAPAAILYKKGKSYFEYTTGWYLVSEVEARIKIYKKDGYEYANQRLPYYTGGSSLKVFFTDAYTYNLAGDKVEKTKLRGDGEFDEKVNDEYSIKKIAMPNVKEGSVVEFKYVIKTPYFQKLPDWYFQYDIPANMVEYEVALPDYFRYNRYLAGYIAVNHTQPVARKALGGNFNEAVTKFTVTNVKAMKEESYVNNIRNYMSILKHELASIHPPNGGMPEYYSIDWETVSKRVYENDDFGDQLALKSYFEDDMKALLQGNLPNDEKVAKIFNYVKSRMTWNGEETYFTDKGVAKAYKEKVGNVAEINLMLTAMLRFAKLNANPVLVSTRGNGVALYPNMSAYDYVIAAVKTDSGYMLLDATSKYTLPDVLPIRALNWAGRMIREDGTNVDIDLMPKSNSKEIMNVSVAMDKEGKLTGRMRDQYYDYNALIFRENYNEISKDSYIEKLEKYYKGMEVGDYNVTNDKDLSKPVVEDFTFVHNNISDVIGNKIYFNPMLFLAREVNPFKEEKREYPIDFTYQQQDKYMINITIPEGYMVESLPKPVSLVMEQNIGSFRYNIVSQGNQIQLNVAFDINYANISQDYYDTIKDFFRKMVEKQTEKVIISKV